MQRARISQHETPCSRPGSEPKLFCRTWRTSSARRGRLLALLAQVQARTRLELHVFLWAWNFDGSGETRARERRVSCCVTRLKTQHTSISSDEASTKLSYLRGDDLSCMFSGLGIFRGLGRDRTCSGTKGVMCVTRLKTQHTSISGKTRHRRGIDEADDAHFGLDFVQHASFLLVGPWSWP